MWELLLTVEQDSHLGLEMAVGELPESKGLPGRALQQAEAHADGVLRWEARRVDVPAGGSRGPLDQGLEQGPGYDSRDRSHDGAAWTAAEQRH